MTPEEPREDDGLKNPMRFSLRDRKIAMGNYLRRDEFEDKEVTVLEVRPSEGDLYVHWDWADDEDGDEGDSKWSPAGFEVPEPERDDSDVVCSGCGEVDPISEMGMTFDTTRGSDEAPAEIRRRYVHNDQGCLDALMKNVGLVRSGGEDE